LNIYDKNDRIVSLPAAFVHNDTHVCTKHNALHKFYGCGNFSALQCINEDHLALQVWDLLVLRFLTNNQGKLD